MNPPLSEPRHVIVAFLALDRYLLAGGVDAPETREALDGLRRTYRGPSQHLLDTFHELGSVDEVGRWLSQLRHALEQEIASEVWDDVMGRERAKGQTEEPPERLSNLG